MIRRLGMCSSSSSTLMGWQAGGCSFFAPWLHGGLVRKLDWGQGRKRRRGPIFPCQIPCVSLCQSLYQSPPQTHQLPSLTFAHTSTVRLTEEEFRLPMSVPSVKLIRLRALDNSIISDSFDDRKALTTAKNSSHTILPNITVSPNTPCWQV